jgi:hypothetical protein
MKQVDDEMHKYYLREQKIKQDMIYTTSELNVARSLNSTFKEKNNELETLINRLSLNFKTAEK